MTSIERKTHKDTLIALFADRGLEPRDWRVVENLLCCQLYKNGKHWGGAHIEVNAG